MTPEPPPKRESGLPLLGLIISGLGLMFPPLLLVGLGIGVVALVRKKGSPVQAVLAVLIPLVALIIFGSLLVVAWPKYKARREQAGPPAPSGQPGPPGQQRPAGTPPGP